MNKNLSNKSIVIALLFFLCSSSLYSQNTGVNLALDEDYFVKPLGLNQDRNYTLGFHLSFFNKNWNKFLAKYLKIKKGEDNLLPSEFSFDVVAFTPDVIKASEIQYNDRPYSNAFFLSLKRHGLNKEGNKYYAKTLYVGVLGTDLAKYFQTKIHDVMNDNRPNGWHNQISDGGELTLLYNVKQSSLVFDSKFFQLNNGINYNLFYTTNLTYSLGARFGFFNKDSWLVDMSGLINNVSNYTKKNTKKKNEWYLYFNLNNNLNLYNVALHGQFRSSAYRLPYRQTGFVTIDTSLGIAFTIKRYTFSIYHKLRSPEIWNSDYNHWHNWAGFSFVCTPDI